MKFIIGIDEVGRGPLAGPVAVCAFRCANDHHDKLIQNGKEKYKLPLRDSKKLTKIQREKWFNYLKDCRKRGECDYKVSYIQAVAIDKFGLTHSIKKALKRSLLKVAGEPHLVSVYLDGGLKAPEEFISQSTHIKGDELYPIISCASIVAKVSRDRIMRKYKNKYPGYGFENHVGYATKAHYKAIRKSGITPIHRKTFLNVIT